MYCMYMMKQKNETHMIWANPMQHTEQPVYKNNLRLNEITDRQFKKNRSALKLFMNFNKKHTIIYCIIYCLINLEFNILNNSMTSFK